MNAYVLNNIPRAAFAVNSTNPEKVRLNAEGKDRTLNRDTIISAGRIALSDYFGRQINANKNNSEYECKVKEDFQTFSRNAWEDTVLFCAAMANKGVGKEPYTSMDEVAKDRSLYTSNTFWRALQTISEEVIYPLLPAVMDGSTERLVSWYNGRLGETKLIDIESNDFFVFDDDSWGSVSSKPAQYLYKSQIAITPKPYTAKAKIKWYQDIIDGTAGRYYAAFARGAANKVYAIMLANFKKAIANSKYMPSAQVLAGYSLAHWNEALMKTAALNGVARNQLVCVGTLSGLSQVLPTVGTGGAVAGIQGLIGEEFVRNGYLGNVAGVDLVEMGLAVVPGTQNYNPKYMSIDDASQENLYIMAKVGVAPMVGVMAEGSPITIVFEPTQTADMTIDITETIIMDVAPAFSNKMYKIELA